MHRIIDLIKKLANRRILISRVRVSGMQEEIWQNVHSANQICCRRFVVRDVQTLVVLLSDRSLNANEPVSGHELNPIMPSKMSKHIPKSKNQHVTFG